jgi:hypothetical protein
MAEGAGVEPADSDLESSKYSVILRNIDQLVIFKVLDYESLVACFMFDFHLSPDL